MYFHNVFRYRPFKTLRHTINIIQNLSIFNTEYVLASFLLDGRKLLFTFTGEYKCRSLFRKIKQFHSSKVSFQKRISLSDHLNVISRNIYLYFDYILAKTRGKNDHYVAILRLRAFLPISEKYH